MKYRVEIINRTPDGGELIVTYDGNRYWVICGKSVKFGYWLALPSNKVSVDISPYDRVKSVISDLISAGIKGDVAKVIAMAIKEVFV
jgi:hypothetical protein